MTKADEDAIREIELRFNQAWGRHDPDAMVESLVDDAQFVTVNGAWTKTRDGFRDLMRRLHGANGPFRSSTRETPEMHVRFLALDVAVMHSRLASAPVSVPGWCGRLMGAGAPSQCRTPTCARGGGTKRPDQPLRFTKDCANHGNTCTAMPRHRPLASRRQKLDRPWDGRQHSVSPLLPQHLEHSMPKTLWLALMLSASLVGLVLAQSHHGDTSSGPPESGFAAQMMQAMQRMDAGMMAAKSTGNPDRDFAAMMIPHHQGAIDMAKLELIYGRDPVLRRLAEGILVEQQQEIELMQRYLHEGSAPQR